eukprot:TRINITY_DN3298_c1_g4_i1.p1 TRINITY_DN3298_c1_g4~~TRINITY_DN3298_c1_g4_i1.p1  ORF type:complete len:431 (-),score=53.74 TRINITY_DN3298_c1_g4_i1:87-1379(-)
MMLMKEGDRTTPLMTTLLSYCCSILILTSLLFQANSLAIYCDGVHIKDFKSNVMVGKGFQHIQHFVFAEYSMCPDDDANERGDNISVVVVNQDYCHVSDKIETAYSNGWGGIILERYSDGNLGQSSFDVRTQDALKLDIVAVETQEIISSTECNSTLSIDPWQHNENEVLSYATTPQYYFINAILILSNAIVFVLSLLSFFKNHESKRLEFMGGCIIVACMFGGIFGMIIYIADTMLFTWKIISTPARAMLHFTQSPLALFANGLIIASFFSAATVDVSVSWISVMRRILIGVSTISLILVIFGVLGIYLAEILFLKQFSVITISSAGWFALAVIFYMVLLIISIKKIEHPNSNVKTEFLKRAVLGIYVGYMVGIIGMFIVLYSSAFHYFVSFVSFLQTLLFLWCLYFTRPNRYKSVSKANSKTVGSSKK